MPNRDDHACLGAITGFAASTALAIHARSQHPVLEMIAGTLGGLVGGLLPDFIDRPTSPHHRSIAHGVFSAGVGMAVSIAKVQAWQAWLRQKAAFYQDRVNSEGGHFEVPAIALHLLAGFLAGVIAGYTSHLTADLFTPKSLPAFC